MHLVNGTNRLVVAIVNRQAATNFRDCLSIAEHFRGDAHRARGKDIAGDDTHLLAACGGERVCRGETCMGKNGGNLINVPQVSKFKISVYFLRRPKLMNILGSAS